MHLVKDIQDSKVVYYWGKPGRVASPAFSQLKHARNWLIGKIWSRYSGPERRKTVDDRRRDSDTSLDFSKTYNLKRQRPKGRRKTDLIETSVSVDLCPIRLQAALKAG